MKAGVKFPVSVLRKLVKMGKVVKTGYAKYKLA